MPCRVDDSLEAVRRPNRPFSFEDLERPSYKRVLERMDALASREDVSYLHPSKRWEYPWALERAGLAPGSRILDAGCGASIFPIYLADQGHRVAAVDRDLDERLDRRHGVSVDYLSADLNALPFSESAFETIFCISVIEHLPRESLHTALEEMRRVLGKGGRLLLTTDYYKRADAELWYEGAGRRFRVDWNVFDETALRQLIAGSPGLEIEGSMDYRVDWDEMRPKMLRFHGYAYTTIGFVFVKI